MSCNTRNGGRADKEEEEQGKGGRCARPVGSSVIETPPRGRAVVGCCSGFFGRGFCRTLGRGRGVGRDGAALLHGRIRVEISGALDDAKEPAESISTLSYATALHVTAECTMRYL